MKVLLLHAFPLDETMWEPRRAALAGHAVVAGAGRIVSRGRPERVSELLPGFLEWTSASTS